MRSKSTCKTYSFQAHLSSDDVTDFEVVHLIGEKSNRAHKHIEDIYNYNPCHFIATFEHTAYSDAFDIPDGRHSQMASSPNPIRSPGNQHYCPR